MTSVLEKRKFGHRHVHSRKVDDVKTPEEDSHPKANKRGFRRNQDDQHLDFGLF